MKKTLIGLVVGLSVVITGCDDNKMEAEAIEFAQMKVKTRLADPESATFSDMKFVDLHAENKLPFGEYIVCGKVKGRDAHGNDFETEFASDLILETKKFNDQEKDFLTDIYPRYDFVTGMINREYYNYATACSDGVEAYQKKMNKKD
ncbi:hypothetical protein [Raoultella ornithinolytica]|uniref:hypothetical protein n=1 Tax=Raoultella ornithinolytica TaxID=54291 RepID=UPI000E57C67C|nr:hypothetical protein [Raoultella ornithinolytica]